MGTIAWFIFWIVLLVFLSAFFSCSETSLFSLSRSDLSYLKETNPATGTGAEHLLGTPRKTLVTILIGNMFVNVLSTALFEQNLHDTFQKYAILISIAVMTPLILLFGEIIPKIIAFRYRRWTVIFLSPVIRFLYVVLYPFQAVSIKLSEPFLGLFTILFPTDRDEEKPYNRDEINAAIEIGAARGIFNEYEKDLVQNIMKIDTETARHLVTPRTRIFSISIDEPIEQIRELILSSEYSRIPFYQDSMDNIIGVFFKKEIFRYDNIFKDKATFRQFLTKPWFVPETIKAGKLFALMVGRKSHIHFAVDEYGGLEGLVTLDDILSKIFRNVDDESELKEHIKYNKTDKSYRVNAEITIGDFNECVPVRIEDTESVTLAGFVADQLGHIPENGDTFLYGGYEFRIIVKPHKDALTIELKPAEDQLGEERTN